MFEIEKRGILTKRKYDELLSFLRTNGESLGADDKNVVYYIYDDKLLKVVDNISKRNAKISLKTNKIGKGSVFPETEVSFPREDFDKIKLILDSIAKPQKVMQGVQKRYNFLYKGCEFALKWSKYWNYHFEIEKVVEHQKQIDTANNDLEMVAKELGIKIMSDNELKAFTKKAEGAATDSLRDLLLEKNKPKHQYNDKESVEWIKMYEPNFRFDRSKIEKELAAIREIEKIRPWDLFENKFYFSKQVLKGIHGKNHAIRVAIYILLIYLSQKNRDIDIQDLVLCALFHDCSRTNDNSDEKHGESSARIFEKHAQEAKFDPKNLKRIIYAISFHDLDYNKILHKNSYIKNKDLCDLLKTADSLDRYRLPKTDWWIKNEYLKIIPNDFIKKIAFTLTSNTESEYIETGDVDYKKNLNILISNINRKSKYQ